MKKTFLLLSMTILCSLLMAGISQYLAFTESNATYVEITGTALTAAQGDDVISPALDIGFPFSYGAETFTQVKVSSNGYITLGTAPGSTNANDLESATFCPVIAALWDDLHTGRVTGTTNPVTSSVQYLASGTEPHRKFTVQYKNAYWDYATDPRNSYVDFQIVLSENGEIDIKYGPNSDTNPRPQAGASIGINMLPGGSGNFYSITPGTPSTASTTVEQDSIRIHVPNGTVYNFSPSVPNDLAATVITGNLSPNLGVSTNYVVTVSNVGSALQSTYQVKLMSGINELASATSTALAPGQTMDVTIPWTPNTAGQMAIFGKVVLTGDQNSQNDQTAPINIEVVNMNGTLAGYVRNNLNMAIMGATVTVDSTTATTAANGIYSMLLPAGSYTVNCHANGYNEQEQENIVITGTMTTVANFILSPVANDDNVISADTRLLGNYPNPFSSGTSIRYYTKTAQPVHIDIFNSKGQLIRSWQQFTPVGSDGISEIHWNGTDAKGIGVANGIYTFRMSTGGYTASRHMILLK